MKNVPSSNMNLPEISPTIRSFLRERGFGTKISLNLAGTAGSQRMYYRLSKNLASYILLISPSHDKDFHKFLRLTQFYRLVSFPVPRVYNIDEERHQVLLEDLGSIRLYDAVRKSPGQSDKLYTRCLQLLIELQTRCYQQYLECPDISSQVFNRAQLHWESRYFLEAFVQGHLKKKLSAPRLRSLQIEFDGLAKAVDAQPKTIMHRDFQSQNIMVQGDRLRVIDYQGSRLGSKYYDVASLLLDPYVMLSEPEIRELFAYYHTQSLSTEPVEEAYLGSLKAGTQRIMQALGAFAFLTHTKKVRGFSKFIRPGVERLKWLTRTLKLKTIYGLVKE